MNLADSTSPQALERLHARHRPAVPDTPPEAVFEAVAEAAAHLCGVPIASISLVDSERQWSQANIGLPGVAETPHNGAFGDHAIRGERRRPAAGRSR